MRSFHLFFPSPYSDPFLIFHPLHELMSLRCKERLAPLSGIQSFHLRRWSMSVGPNLKPLTDGLLLWYSPLRPVPPSFPLQQFSSSAFSPLSVFRFLFHRMSTMFRPQCLACPCSLSSSSEFLRCHEAPLFCDPTTGPLSTPALQSHLRHFNSFPSSTRFPPPTTVSQGFPSKVDPSLKYVWDDFIPFVRHGESSPFFDCTLS